jgi:hypothetical protein
LWLLSVLVSEFFSFPEVESDPQHQPLAQAKQRSKFVEV